MPPSQSHRSQRLLGQLIDALVFLGALVIFLRSDAPGGAASMGSLGAYGLAWILMARRFRLDPCPRTLRLRQISEAWLGAIAVGLIVDVVSSGGAVTFTAPGAIAAYLGLILVRLVRLELQPKREPGPARFLLVGSRPRQHPLLQSLEKAPDELGLELAGHIHLPGETDEQLAGLKTLGNLGQLPSILAREPVDSVLLCPGDSVAAEHVNRALSICDAAGVGAHYFPPWLELEHLRVQLAWQGQRAGLTFVSAGHRSSGSFAKRFLDVFGAAAGLALSAPALLLAALAIKLEDGGPILFRQVRVGRGGSLFTCYKLRTMVCDAEALKNKLTEANEQDGPAFKMKRDPRITRVGRLLRKFSLDELPQFLNVMIGDMSLVGPRPPVPSEVAEYELWQLRRISVKPGLTCIWQVWGRNATTFRRWMEMDLQYIDNWSLWLDLKLIAHTVRTVVRGTGS